MFLVARLESQMRVLNRRLFVAAAAGLAVLVVAACQPASSDKAPDKIRVGYAISLTGAYEPGATTSQTPNYRLWAHDVNARGGIMLSKYGKRVPIELIELDDQSDVETAVRLDEQLATLDKVDLLLPPWGTAMQVAVAPTFNKYQYPQIAVTAQSLQLHEKSLQWPYAFWFLPQPDEQTAHLETYLRDLRLQGKLGRRPRYRDDFSVHAGARQRRLRHRVRQELCAGNC
jgi:branched-chain amino acid transport system substrate-binding protein